MKKSWLLFSLSYCFLSVQAQFHTIAYSKSLYKVEEVAEQMETKSLPENGEADTPVSLTSMAGKQSEKMRSQWIDCYVSVSYPLKKIIVTWPKDGDCPKDGFVPVYTSIAIPFVPFRMPLLILGYRYQDVTPRQDDCTHPEPIQ